MDSYRGPSSPIIPSDVNGVCYASPSQTDSLESHCAKIQYLSRVDLRSHVPSRKFIFLFRVESFAFDQSEDLRCLVLYSATLYMIRIFRV